MMFANIPAGFPTHAPNGELLPQFGGLTVGSLLPWATEHYSVRARELVGLPELFAQGVVTAPHREEFYNRHLPLNDVRNIAGVWKRRFHYAFNQYRAFCLRYRAYMTDAEVTNYVNFAGEFHENWVEDDYYYCLPMLIALHIQCLNVAERVSNEDEVNVITVLPFAQ